MVLIMPHAVPGCLFSNVVGFILTWFTRTSKQCMRVHIMNFFNMSIILVLLICYARRLFQNSITTTCIHELEKTPLFK
jgi:hypothetical protein